MSSSIRHSDITKKIIKAFYEVYNELGHGFLEAVYEKSIFISLKNLGLEVTSQHPIPVYFKQNLVGNFIADLIVEDKVIIELKAVEHIIPQHEAQLINYLKATNIEVGLLMNFGNKPEFKRFIFTNN